MLSYLELRQHMKELALAEIRERSAAGEHIDDSSFPSHCYECLKERMPPLESLDKEWFLDCLRYSVGMWDQDHAGPLLLTMRDHLFWAIEDDIRDELLQVAVEHGWVDPYAARRQPKV